MSDDETIKKGRANLQRGIETVGGSLSLTNDQLVFTPHDTNFQRDPVAIGVNEIQSVAKGWTKFLGFIPLFPNTLSVQTGAETHRFVVSDRDGWAAAIQSRTQS
ncbi:MAG TPA: hypothetical protein VIC53_05775 [Wenzhouxiangella sp.]